jgi:phospholipase C
VKTLPTDPKNTGAFVYTYTPANTNTTYTISACLENDQDNGDNVIAPGSSNNTSCTTKVFQLANGN